MFEDKKLIEENENNKKLLEQYQEREKELIGKIDKLTGELEDIKTMKLSGRSLKQWIQEAIEQEVEWHHSELKGAILDKEIELKQKFFKETQDLQIKVQMFEVENQSLKTKNEMLEKMTEISGEVIDIKELINSLINKLPEMKFDKLSVNIEPKQNGKE
jgi:hypothetical protein